MNPLTSPIDFKTAEAVRSVLSGRKTVFREVVEGEQGKLSKLAGDSNCLAVGISKLACPYGGVGDYLWVREPWRVGAWRDDGYIAIDYIASPELTNTSWLEPPMEDYICLVNQSLDDCKITEATYTQMTGRYEWQAGSSPCRMRLGESMPMWASRAILQITNVSIQRLQSITEEGAIKEGMGSPITRDCKLPQFIQHWDRDHLEANRWMDNPWVWVIEFECVVNQYPANKKTYPTN